MIWSPGRRCWLDEFGNPILPLELATLRPEWGVAADRPWKYGPFDLTAWQHQRYRERMRRALDAIGPHIAAGMMSWGGWHEVRLPWAYWWGERYDATRYDARRPPDLELIEEDAALTTYLPHPPAYHILREPAWNWLRQGRGAAQVAHDLAAIARAIRRGDPDRTRPIVWSEAHAGWGKHRGWTERNFRLVCAEVAPLVEIVGIDLYRDRPLDGGPDWRPLWWGIPELADTPMALSECSWDPWVWIEGILATDPDARKRLARASQTGTLCPPGSPARGYPHAADPAERALRAAEQWVTAARWERITMLSYRGGISYASGSSGYAPGGIAHDPVAGYWLDEDPEVLEIARGGLARARLTWAGGLGR